jgi:hypothetical protein
MTSTLPFPLKECRVARRTDPADSTDGAAAEFGVRCGVRWPRNYQNIGRSDVRIAQARRLRFRRDV